jgi:hypothetical protein
LPSESSTPEFSLGAGPDPGAKFNYEDAPPELIARANQILLSVLVRRFLVEVADDGGTEADFGERYVGAVDGAGTHCAPGLEALSAKV